MPTNNHTPLSYEAVIADLQARIRDGQARFDAWATEKRELESALEALRPVVARQGPQLGLTFGEGPKMELKPNAAHMEGLFEGMSYPEAIRFAFKSAGKPLAAPDVADMLFEAGYSSPRKRVKNNVDSNFHAMKKSGELRQRPDKKYEMAK